MGPRWKGKSAETKALEEPISQIVSQLQYSLQQSHSEGILLGCAVILAADPKQTELLNRSCFGRPIITSEKSKQFFQLTLEEAFYLSYSLKCIQIIKNEEKDSHVIFDQKLLWNYMRMKRENFPNSFKAYAHLRAKNWVVRSGSQYGVDFVAYRHHPSLVHSEYAVLVLPGGDDDLNNGRRLRVWSDFHCTLRLCGSVAKMLLVLTIDRNGGGVDDFPACLERYYCVEERTVTRWSAEQCREDQKVMESGSK